MRLGELKNILDKVLVDGKIKLETTSQFNGNAYKIGNHQNVINALKELKKQKWNSISSEPLDNFISTYEYSDSAIITSQEYTSLTQYITQLNTKLPLFYGILNSSVEEQNEQVINVKLPNKNDFTLDELSEINKRLDTLFKIISIDGNYKFDGFDTGTSWYKIIIIGEITYRLFVCALETGQKIFKFKKEYYESSIAKINYEAAKETFSKNTEQPPPQDEQDEYIKYIEKVIKLKICEEARQNVEKLSLDKKYNSNETETKLTKTVDFVLKELDNGLEFHLSLNPPSYIKEDNLEISINYEEIRTIENAKKTTKQIPDKTDENSNNE